MLGAIHISPRRPSGGRGRDRVCRNAGILTSLDGGGLRSNTHEVLEFIDIAVVAERLCEQMRLSPGEMTQYLRSRGCRVGGVTMGPRGLLYYQGTGPDRIMPALAVPDARIIDTNGAGDIFHGAYIHSYLTKPFATWDDHFRFARAASAHAIQHLGNEASLPSLNDIDVAHGRFEERRETPLLMALE